MADFRMNELTESSAIANSDIMHLRTSGGIDKKITGTNLRDTLVTKVLDINSTQGVSLSSYTTNLTIIGTQTSAITLSVTNVLANGKEFKILNPTVHLMTVTLGGETYEVSEDGELIFTSDSSAMIKERELSTVVTGTTSYKIKKGDRGKIIKCEPTADMTLTITNATTDERDYITLINNSVYKVIVTDTTNIFWLEGKGKKANFFIADDTNLWRSQGWGLVFDDQSNVIDVPTASVLGGITVGGYRFENNNASNSSFSVFLYLDQLSWNTKADSTTAYNQYIQATASFGTSLVGEKIKKIWKWYE